VAAARNDKVYQAVETHRQFALICSNKIVNIDSGTGDVEGGRKVEAVLRTQLVQLGAEVRSEPAEAAGLPTTWSQSFVGPAREDI